ncbi:hypothetical protein EYF80_054985 [Liparis tanakae]|uniref:Uncharacterized protein n=1 Tax=Liparis tanakae TaxID=230148 RepID=A0A4Z2F1U2_9TELE|nr:hypothetical protein EYF80_054985 [Liparis tanakae]
MQSRCSVCLAASLKKKYSRERAEEKEICRKRGVYAKLGVNVWLHNSQRTLHLYPPWSKQGVLFRSLMTTSGAFGRDCVRARACVCVRMCEPCLELFAHVALLFFFGQCPEPRG